MAVPMNHRPDLFDHVELSWPKDLPECPPLPNWLTADIEPCMDCRANLFMEWRGGMWFTVTAHDDGCPFLMANGWDTDSTVDP